MNGTRSTVAVSLAFCVVAAASLGAKGETTQIRISGGNLASPVRIADPVVLRQFQVWSGAGTFRRFGGGDSIEATEGFIVDWSSGVVADPPKGLPRYEVAFYTGAATGPVYVVYYEPDPSSNGGYVYLPGKGEELYVSNTRSILRGHGFEGHWLRATRAWRQAAASVLQPSPQVPSPQSLAPNL
jgi:hypothetical protein